DGAVVGVTVRLGRALGISGRCVDLRGQPVAGAWAQAFSEDGARPASELVKTEEKDGSFALAVDAASATYRVRAVAPRSLPLCADGASLPQLVGDAEVRGVAAGGEPLEIRMPDEPAVVLEVTGDVPIHHLQLEGLVFDDAAQAWGRLGGP